MRDMSKEELERYAPYHTFREFWEGYDDYEACNDTRQSFYNDVAGQAYDRGAELAMRRGMARLRARQAGNARAITLHKDAND